MYCKECGKIIEDKNGFCKFCGTPVNIQTETSERDNPKVTKFSKKKICIIMSAVLISSLIIAIVILLIQPNNNSEATDEPAMITSDEDEDIIYLEATDDDFAELLKIDDLWLSEKSGEFGYSDFDCNTRTTKEAFENDIRGFCWDLYMTYFNEDTIINNSAPAENVEWIMKNILNMKNIDRNYQSDISFYNDGFYYFSYTSNITIPAYHCEIQSKEKIENNKYKIVLNNYIKSEGTLDTVTELVVGLKEIDSKRVWSFFSVKRTPSKPAANVLTQKIANKSAQTMQKKSESKNDWKQAAIDVLYNAPSYFGESLVNKGVEFHIIDLNGDDVPEILAYPTGGTGPAFSGFCYWDGREYKKGSFDERILRITKFYNTETKENEFWFGFIPKDTVYYSTGAHALRWGCRCELKNGYLGVAEYIDRIDLIDALNKSESAKETAFNKLEREKNDFHNIRSETTSMSYLYYIPTAYDCLALDKWHEVIMPQGTAANVIQGYLYSK